MFCRVHAISKISCSILTNWCIKGCAMYYLVYQEMHVKDPQLSVVRVGHRVPLAGFCLSLYGLHVLNRDVNMNKRISPTWPSPLCLQWAAHHNSLLCCVFADIVECDDPNICGTGGTCNNTIGSYTCICGIGYRLKSTDPPACEGILFTYHFFRFPMHIFVI